MLSVSDVAVDSHESPQSLTIHLKWSKCDQYKVGVTIHMGCTFHTLCPVVALLRYLALRPVTPGPLFIFQDGSTLSNRKLSSALNAALGAAGINSGKYMGHSFRIGAATAAAAAGLEDYLWAGGNQLPFKHTFIHRLQSCVQLPRG